MSKQSNSSMNQAGTAVTGVGGVCENFHANGKPILPAEEITEVKKREQLATQYHFPRN